MRELSYNGYTLITKYDEKTQAIIDELYGYIREYSTMLLNSEKAKGISRDEQIKLLIDDRILRNLRETINKIRNTSIPIIRLVKEDKDETP